jgi:hypothetical protein
MICSASLYSEGNEDSGVAKKAAIFIVPAFGTVS